MKRQLRPPEVIQLGAMDCGPAVLKCMTSAWGITLDLELVRNAVQSSIDGTSIDTLEDTLNALGVPARQYLIPEASLYFAAANYAPFILVTRTPSSTLHFIVVWRASRGRIQVMDPSVGRLWLRPAELATQLYFHTATLTPRQARAQTIFFDYLKNRMRGLQLPPVWKQRLEAARKSDAIDTVEALYTIVEDLDAWVRAGVMQPGREAAQALESAFHNWDAFKPPGRKDFATRTRIQRERQGRPTGGSYSVFSTEVPFLCEVGPGQVLTVGVIILCARKRDAKPAPADPLLVAASRGAIIQREPSLLSHALSVVARDKSEVVAVLALHLPLVIAVTIGEVFLLRAALSVSPLLATGIQRLGAVVAYVSFFLATLVLELVVVHGLLQVGRRAEIGTQVDVLPRLARMKDIFFRSRLLSDLAHRTYSATQLHNLPSTLSGIVREGLDLIVVIIAVSFLSAETGAVLALCVIILGIALYVSVRWFRVAQHKKLEQEGALSRFYLDALLGQVPIRTHGAASCLRVKFEDKIVDWYHAGKELVERSATANAVTQVLFAVATIGTVAAAVLGSVARESMLLLLLWTQRIPGALIKLTAQLRTLPLQAHVARRLTEPLRTADSSCSSEALQPPSAAVEIEFRGVALDVVGCRILDQINLKIGGAEHVAIVGASGSGKSTLMQAVLGFYEPSEGTVLVNGAPLDEPHLTALRRVTAWVDPTVHLSGHSLMHNVFFGNERRDTRPLDEAADLADLKSVLESLPGGYQRLLGEAGRLLSGGEGQRVRLARAFLARDTQLVLLDEAFRGLENSKRRDLLHHARITWAAATLLCITHDIMATMSFPRVVVIKDGHIVEDGVPADLMSRDTLYAKMLERERTAKNALWSDPHWETLTVGNGTVTRER